MSACAADIVQHPLHVVLQHLSSDDGDQQLYNTTARALHRTCKQYQSAARATLRTLRLDRCFHLWLARISFPGVFSSQCPAPVAPVPLGLLAACPRATILTLHPKQLLVLNHYEVQQLAAAAGQLKRLEITQDAWPEPRYDAPAAYLTEGDAAQLVGLRQLLRVLSHLEEVHISMPFERDHACWVLRQDSTSSSSISSISTSTSSSSAVGPPLRLSSWEWTALPADFFLRWFVQQQMGRTLRRLVLIENAYDINSQPPKVDVSALAAATSLEDLTVKHVIPSSLQCLSSSSSLTRLQLGDGYHEEDPDAAAVAAGALTSLRHLVMTLEGPALPGSISALQQLSCLEIKMWSCLEELPADLGTQLPRLVRLVAQCNWLRAIPASLSRLTHLVLKTDGTRPITLPATMAGALKELHLSFFNLAAVHGLSRLTGLELLVASAVDAPGSTLAVLQPLTRLRHLALVNMWERGRYIDPSVFTIFGALQQLTSITASGRSAAYWQALAANPPPAGLKELFVSTDDPSVLATLAPWLGQATALTRLSLGCCPATAHAQEVLSLPRQLVELDLGCVDWAEGHLPRGLLRLTALEVLHVCVPDSGLPTWFTKLRRLEGLELHGGGDPSSDAGVLAALPSLRALRLEDIRLSYVPS